MFQQNNDDLISAVSNALRNSVPNGVYEATLDALRRCHDLMARSLPHIEHEEMRQEVAIYANILEGYFQTGDMEPYSQSVDLRIDEPSTVTLTENLKELLRSKGVNIPRGKTSITTQEMGDFLWRSVRWKKKKTVRRKPAARKAAAKKPARKTKRK